MSKAAEIARLEVLAGMIFDHRLSQLKTTAAAKAQSEAALAGLAAPMPADGLEGAAASLAGISYQRWADARRAEINLILAHQTRDWLDAQSAAREAFGRAEALRGLAEKLKR